MKAIFQKLLVGITWVLCRLLPVNPRKIVVTSFYGLGFGDNPKPIVQELLRRNADVQIVWLTAGKAAATSLPTGVIPCEYHSLRKIYELSTAKVWIDNCRKGARMKRPDQIYMQTWHGFALKRIERDVADKLPTEYESYAIRDSLQTDLIVSDSRFMTDVYRRAFWYDGEILEFGAPRNDLLCNRSARPLGKVHSSLGLPADCRIVLYAPTFRVDGSLDAYCVDYARLRRSCEARFGGHFIVLIRLHPHVMQRASELHFDQDTTFDASPYPDMQELLAAADVVVTDYSSLMFDFSLTGRPCFQFAVDIDTYRSDRNFYFPLDALPFPLAMNNDALEAEILAFDEAQYREKLDAFFAEVGLCTDGHAAQRCADWITAHMKGEA